MKNTEFELSCGWRLGYLPNCECKSFASDIKTCADVEKHCNNIIPASVPGEFQLDLYRNGIEPDPCFGDNSWRYQKYENAHIWYYLRFEAEEISAPYFDFGGLDTIADIYLNGALIAHTENAFIPYKISADGLKNGENELVIHFIPVCIEARKYRLPAMSNTLFYNYQALYIRKPMHEYGWDIMPRMVTCGIVKPVYLKSAKPDSIDELFIYTLWADASENRAKIRIYFALTASSDFLREYTVKIFGKCGDSEFYDECSPYGAEYNRLAFIVENCRLWWPKNQGEQNLYDVRAELWHGDVLCDTKNIKLGIRSVELDRTDTVDCGEGNFIFKINGRKIFALGTNWVPLEMFHSQDEKRLPAALHLLGDSGCNMVRVWGGSVYPDEEFFDFCDEHGIMVWQDFAMACAVYPDDEFFLNNLENEAVAVIKRLRVHPCLVLWAGDNECDCTRMTWGGVIRDPNENMITRAFLPAILKRHDFTRPYLPSSPYISPEAFKLKKPSPEEHLWGPRDYFKTDYYKKSECFFASEIGFHGSPNRESLEKFIKKDELYPVFKSDGEPNIGWLAHCTECQTDGEIPYKYRLKLMESHVRLLFGKLPDDLDTFTKMSQASQAEAFKYFIESFRVKKWRRTGIIWWNLLDGWPQISDAVVDYYFSEKLAYKFIRRVQTPVCVMFDEPDENGKMTLFGANDTCCDAKISYSVKKFGDDKVIASGNAVLSANENAPLCTVDNTPDSHDIFIIEWTCDGEIYRNHYVANMIGIDFDKYSSFLASQGF